MDCYLSVVAAWVRVRGGDESGEEINRLVGMLFAAHRLDDQVKRPYLVPI